MLFQLYLAQIIILENASELSVFRYFHTLTLKIRRNLRFSHNAIPFFTSILFYI